MYIAQITYKHIKMVRYIIHIVSCNAPYANNSIYLLVCS